MATVAVAPTRERIVSAFELPCHLLVSGSSSRHEHHVKPCEAEDRNHQNGDEHHQTHRYYRLCLVQLIFAGQHVEKGEGENAQHVNAQRDEKEEEESVIPPADAIRNPRAMVIEYLQE